MKRQKSKRSRYVEDRWEIYLKEEVNEDELAERVEEILGETPVEFIVKYEGYDEKLNRYLYIVHVTADLSKLTAYFNEEYYTADWTKTDVAKEWSDKLYDELWQHLYYSYKLVD